MPQQRACKAVVWEQTGPTLLARLKDNFGIYVIQDAITSITYSIRDILIPGTLVSGGSLTVVTVVFDTLELAPIWTVDAVGYNFKWPLAKTLIPNSEKYRVEIKFIPITGEQFFLVYELDCKEVLGA
jgi:hypothetical protein